MSPMKIIQRESPREGVVYPLPGRFSAHRNWRTSRDPKAPRQPFFESTNGPESERQVRSGEAFTYPIPLKFLNPGVRHYAVSH